MNHYQPAINELVLAHDNNTTYLGRYLGRIYPAPGSPVDTGGKDQIRWPVVEITHMRLSISGSRDWEAIADGDCTDDGALCEPNLLRIVHPGTIQPVRRFDAENVTALPHGFYVVDRSQT